LSVFVRRRVFLIQALANLHQVQRPI